MNRFVKGNSDTCIGCRTCMIGCVVAHEGIGLFQMSPEEFAFNPKIDIIKTPTISIAVQCKHCESPACLNVCPVSAITRQEDVIIVNEDKCIGCKTCALACPFGAINIAQTKDGKMIANKCDLCAGNNFEPECVKVCLTNSLRIVTEEDLAETISKRRISAAEQLSQTGR